MIKPIELREADFKKQVWEQNYPESVRQEFFDYWTEPNKSGTRMKFEMEKTWHLGRRIARWANNGFNKIVTGPVVKTPVKKEVVTELDKVEVLFERYKAHPADVSFKEFGQWYELLKKEGLLKRFTMAEVNELKEIYNGDNEKCRCACVQLTFNQMANAGISFEKAKLQK